MQRINKEIYNIMNIEDIILNHIILVIIIFLLIGIYLYRYINRESNKYDYINYRY